MRSRMKENEEVARDARSISRSIDSSPRCGCIDMKNGVMDKDVKYTYDSVKRNERHKCEGKDVQA